MSDIFISYARSTEAQARQIAEALRALGYGVWRDDELPAHRSYAEVIEERLKAAKAVVVIWSAEAAKSQWVRAEADLARLAGTLVQLTLDGAAPPLPFNQIQCADLSGWAGDVAAPGWRKVVSSLGELMAGSAGVEPSQPGTRAPIITRPSIAVLPFANLSGDPDQDYFADGMVVEIVGALSSFKSLFVIAAGSSLSLKDQGLTPQDAAARLGVRYALGGSVRKAGGRVRIAVQLIDAHDGAQIWTRHFEDTLDDVFALQDKVALTVAGVIEPTLEILEVRRAAKRPTDNASSYDCCLRVLSLVVDLSKARLNEALAYANRAIGLDPDYGFAIALAARIHYLLYLYGWTDDPDTDRRLAIELTHRSMKVAGDDADVLARASVVLAYLDEDLTGAVALVDRALALNPGSAAVWQASGAVRLQTDDLVLATEHLAMAMRLDPIGPDKTSNLWGMAMIRFQQGRFAEAAAQARALLKITHNPTGYALLAASLGYLGEPEAAAEALAGYRRFAAQPIEAYARLVWRQPERLQRFLDGVAAAEGPHPADAIV